MEQLPVIIIGAVIAACGVGIHRGTYAIDKAARILARAFIIAGSAFACLGLIPLAFRIFGGL